MSVHSYTIATQADTTLLSDNPAQPAYVPYDFLWSPDGEYGILAADWTDFTQSPPQTLSGAFELSTSIIGQKPVALSGTYAQVPAGSHVSAETYSPVQQ